MEHTMSHRVLIAWTFLAMFVLSHGVSVHTMANPTAEPAAAGNTDPVAIHDEIGRLQKAWRIDPLDEVIAQQLGALREKLDQDRTEALIQLVYGLEEYLAGRAHIATKALSRARQSTEVEMLVDSLLPRSLAALEKQTRIAAKTAGVGHICAQCGDSRFKNCSNRLCWRSFGYLPCGTCRGAGLSRKKIKDSTDQADACLTCHGLGLTQCHVCGGQGLILCDACHLPLLDELSPEDGQAIRRVVAIATYLALGGPELYFLGDDVPSPQMAP